jgi:hypothetical protein
MHKADVRLVVFSCVKGYYLKLGLTVLRIDAGRTKKQAKG